MKLRLHSSSWALIAITIVLVVGANFVTLPIREPDKVHAAQQLVAWIVEGRRIPGFSEDYPDALIMARETRFFVVCDFVPAELPLSADARVRRITMEQRHAVFEKHEFEGTDYIVIRLASASERLITLELSNTFGNLGGHGYTFEFRRKLWGLRASGTFNYVS